MSKVYIFFRNNIIFNECKIFSKFVFLKITKMRYFFPCVFIFCFLSNVFSQLYTAGFPDTLRSDIPFISLPVFSLEETLRASEEEYRMTKRMIFAKAFPLEVHSSNAGIWFVSGDKYIWRLGITSAGAFSINIIFHQFALPSDARLFIYNISRQDIRGAFTEKNNNPSGVFAVAPVAGDSIVIEYQLPLNREKKTSFIIAQAAHAFKDVLGTSMHKDGRYGLSGVCNKDIMCPEGDNWQNEKNAVCRLFYNGTTFCTGTLLNNTRHDGKPYVLTAHHCISTNAAAQTAIFVFGYESPGCNAGDGMVNKSISGASLKVTTDHYLDFSLLEMSSAPPLSFEPYYAGWKTGLVPPSSTVTIHHPQGDVKKIAIDNNAPIIGNFGEGYDAFTHWKVLNWESGTTEKGSSGAPLFDNNHYVIGSLSGGLATCDNPVNDYFSVFDYAFSKYSLSDSTHLKPWLDPDNTGATTCNGLSYMRCLTMTNWTGSDVKQAGKLSNPNSGYMTGHNSYTDQFFCERFIHNDTIHAIKGLHMDVFRAKYSLSQSSKIRIKIWIGDSIPRQAIYFKDFLIKDIVAGQNNYFQFDSLVSVPDTFFAGYQIYYVLTDTFSVYMADNRSNNINHAFVYNTANMQWESYTNRYGVYTSLAIYPFFCDSYTVGQKEVKNTVRKELKVYPNPSTGIVHISLPTDIKQGLMMVFSMQGAECYSQILSAGNNITDISFLQSGFYIIRIRADEQIRTSKLIIRKN